ncbi:hypothetical protein CDL15_Pgr017187 [Punica granatum]|nr:hypothetical protein CDL15_Pgr017187 [Punica granatum]
MHGMAAVFFISLERCACIKIETKDDSEGLQLISTADREEADDDNCSVVIDSETV